VNTAQLGDDYMAQVFISYSRKDLSFVEQLAADLKNAGFEVWYDVSGLRGGSRWRFEIEKAIRNSQFSIFILSPDSVASEWVEREFLFSSNLRRNLIPLMYRSCELPLNYLNLNYIDVQGNNYKRNFHEILSALGDQPAASPYQKELENTTARPLARKIMNINPVIYVTAFAILALMIGSNLLVKWYYSRPEQPVTETIPTVPVSFTSTHAILSTPTSSPASPTPSPVLPTGTIPPTLPENVWISYNSTVNGSRDIFLLNPTTGENKEVIADASHDKVGTWSPDGQFLAFESNRGSTDYYQIYLFDNDQRSITRLTELAACSNWAPTWSPDGSKIVFYSNCEDERRDIYVMNRDGSGRKKLTSGPGENKFPVFSPNGNSIAFTSTRDGKDEILLMNVDGSNQRIIAEGCSATFSPDGKWLWFSTICNDSEIKRVQIDGSNLSKIGSMLGYNPSLSPNGQFVVFQASNDIWIMAVDGSNPTQLTFGGALDGAPSWRP
jgi:Tol biopolymer transport system component